MQEPENKRAKRKLIEFPDESTQKPTTKRKDIKYIGIHMNRRDAVNSVLTNLLSMPDKTASVLMEAWDAPHSVCLIVSEQAAQNLFVRSFLFHEPFIVKATTDDHGFASLESGMSKNRLGGPSFRVKWECFGLYSKSLFTDLAHSGKHEMGKQALERMQMEAEKLRVPPPVEVAWTWCSKMGWQPPRGVQRPQTAPGHAQHKRGATDERHFRDNAQPSWSGGGNGMDMQRRQWQSNGGPGRDLRYDGRAPRPARDGFIDRRSPGGWHVGPAGEGPRERQEMGAWVPRGAPGQDRPGAGGGGFLRKRMGESSVRGPSGSRSIPARPTGAVSKRSNKELTDLTFEGYLQVCGEVEEVYRRLLWQHRMSQPKARSEWRALCIQHKVPYQQSFL